MIRAATLLLCLALPLVLGLNFEDGPRAYYVATALLVATLLFDMRHRSGRAWLFVCWLGIGIELLTASCGVWTDSGACDSGTGLPVSTAVLLCIAIAAEVIAQLEAKRSCQQKT